MISLPSARAWYSILESGGHPLSIKQEASLPLQTGPTAPFGVFVTITRPSMSSTQKPIHGCIGNWTADFKPYTSTQLLSTLVDVAPSAAYKDQRRLPFERKLPLWQDGRAEVEVSFMHSIQPFNSQSFDSGMHGLLVRTNRVDSSRRATFLPNVWATNTITQTDIKNKLLEKAGLAHETSTVEWFMYRTTTDHCSLFDLVSERRIFAQVFVEALDAAPAVHAIPYAFSNTLKIQYSQTDDVRNASTLALVTSHPKVEAEITHLQTQPSTSTQAKAFLLDAKRNDMLCSALAEAIRTNQAEPIFEAGEIASRYGKHCLSTPSALSLSALQQFVTQRIMNQSCLVSGKCEQKDVFQLNWLVQSLLYSKHPLNTTQQQQLDLFLNSILLDKESWSGLETNYLVVALELLCALLCIQKTTTYVAHAWNLLVYIYQTRLDHRIGIPRFQSGKREARADMAAHWQHAVSLFYLSHDPRRASSF